MSFFGVILWPTGAEVLDKRDNPTSADIADLCYINLLGMSPDKIKNSRQERGQ